MSLLNNSVGYNQYPEYAPLTEVAKNTRLQLNILDKIQCNTNPLSTLQKFDKNEQQVLLDTATITLPASTYHYYSIVILSGTVDITEGGVTLSNAPQGYSNDLTATTLLENSIVFTGKSSGTIAVIKTLR